MLKVEHKILINYVQLAAQYIQYYTSDGRIELALFLFKPLSLSFKCLVARYILILLFHYIVGSTFRNTILFCDDIFHICT